MPRPPRLTPEECRAQTGHAQEKIGDDHYECACGINGFRWHKTTHLPLTVDPRD